MDEKTLPPQGGEKGDVDDLIFPPSTGPVIPSNR